MVSFEDQIRNIVEKYLNNDFFIVDINVSNNNEKIRIFLDKFSGNITLNECEQLHRMIYPEIEQLQENFSLEVSSPGLSSPLKVWQQFRKNIGQKIKVLTDENQSFEAVILDADNEKILLQKIKNKQEIPMTYNQIKKAFLKLEF